MKAKFIRTFWVCLAALVATYGFGTPTATAQQSKDVFMKKDATPDDWVRALKRDSQPLTRGLRPQHEAHRTEGQREMVKNPVANVLITFEFNSAELTPEAMQQLDGLAQALRKPDLWGDKIRLEGHTDASGSEDYNLSLSQRRAQAVRDYLMQRANLDRGVLEPVGKGETELLNKLAPNARVNRRVTIINVGN